MISFSRIIRNGDYLGYCPDKGYIYSLFLSYDERGGSRYMITAVKNGEYLVLLEYSVDVKGEGEND